MPNLLFKAEIHCYLSSLKSWHNNLFLSGVSRRRSSNFFLKNEIETDGFCFKNCSSLLWEIVFCHQNCSDLLWEKIVLVIEKKFWNSRLKAESFSDLKIFANSCPSATNFSRSLEHLFFTVGQNNFGDKIPSLTVGYNNFWIGQNNFGNKIPVLMIEKNSAFSPNFCSITVRTVKV